MTIEEALVAFLKGDAGVAALVGTALYPHGAPQAKAPPYVSYQLVSQTELGDLGGPSGLKQSRVQLDCQGGTGARAYAQARAVAEAVKAASGGSAGSPADPSAGSRTKQLHGWRGTWGTAPNTLWVERCWAEDLRGGFEPPRHAEEKGPQRVSLDLVIWHR